MCVLRVNPKKRPKQPTHGHTCHLDLLLLLPLLLALKQKLARLVVILTTFVAALLVSWRHGRGLADAVSGL